MSGNRCESDCRSRGCKFHPGPVPYFRGDWPWNNFYGHSPTFRWIRWQLQANVCARSNGKLLVQACPGKSLVRWTYLPAMTIAVDLGHKATKQTTDSVDPDGMQHYAAFHLGLTEYEGSNILVWCLGDHTQEIKQTNFQKMLLRVWNSCVSIVYNGKYFR